MGYTLVRPEMKFGSKPCELAVATAGSYISGDFFGSPILKGLRWV